MDTGISWFSGVSGYFCIYDRRLDRSIMVSVVYLVYPFYSEKKEGIIGSDF